MEERLQKIIARAGIASRRHAEELITSGLVTLNGRVVTELGTKADAARDHIKVNGKLLQPETGERIYLLLHKPPEVVSTMNDPEGRPSLRGFLHAVPERVYPVGRLEYHASGLVLLTNDGDFANKILQSHNLPQTYQMKLKSLLTFREIETLERETGAKISRERGKESPWYEVTLSEASQDKLRSRLFQTGHPVEKVRRVRIGNLGLDRLTPGQFRLITPAEAKGLLRDAASGNGHAAGHGVESRQRTELGARRDFRPEPRREFQPAAKRDAPRERPRDERERPRFRPSKPWKKTDQRSTNAPRGEQDDRKRREHAGPLRGGRPDRGPRRERAGQRPGERSGPQQGERHNRGERQEHQAPWRRKERGAQNEGRGQRPPRRNGMRRDARPGGEGRSQRNDGPRREGGPIGKQFGNSPGRKPFSKGPGGKRFSGAPGRKKFGSSPRHGGKH